MRARLAGLVAAGKTEEDAIEALADVRRPIRRGAARRRHRLAEARRRRLSRSSSGSRAMRRPTSARPARSPTSTASRSPRPSADGIAKLVEATWTVFDRIVAVTPDELRKGPRGGGRDRDKMVDHVLGAETSYVRKIGVKHKVPARDDAAAITARCGRTCSRPWSTAQPTTRGRCATWRGGSRGTCSITRGRCRTNATHSSVNCSGHSSVICSNSGSAGVACGTMRACRRSPGPMWWRRAAIRTRAAMARCSVSGR